MGYDYRVARSTTTLDRYSNALEETPEYFNVYRAGINQPALMRAIEAFSDSFAPAPPAIPTRLSSR